MSPDLFWLNLVFFVVGQVSGLSDHASLHRERGLDHLQEPSVHHVEAVESVSTLAAAGTEWQVCADGGQLSGHSSFKSSRPTSLRTG